MFRAPEARAVYAVAAAVAADREQVVRAWTRNERTRILAALPLEEVLRDAVPAPAYQRLAPKAAALRLEGWRDHAIAVEFGVTDKTIAKAIRWLPA
ncbi:MAG: hypothetical protein OXH52_06000 [Gammaproteobacteria bacterium]|nr:hypothetical protein [Gammaproteobacteria bacterium]